MGKIITANSIMAAIFYYSSIHRYKSSQLYQRQGFRARRKYVKFSAPDYRRRGVASRNLRLTSALMQTQVPKAQTRCVASWPQGRISAIRFQTQNSR